MDTTKPPLPVVPAGYMPCPQCRRLTYVRNGSGIMITCPKCEGAGYVKEQP